MANDALKIATAVAVTTAVLLTTNWYCNRKPSIQAQTPAPIINIYVNGSLNEPTKPQQPATQAPITKTDKKIRNLTERVIKLENSTDGSIMPIPVPVGVPDWIMYRGQRVPWNKYGSYFGDEMFLGFMADNYGWSIDFSFGQGHFRHPEMYLGHGFNGGVFPREGRFVPSPVYRNFNPHMRTSPIYGRSGRHRY